jgi:hypothetical protein
MRRHAPRRSATLGLLVLMGLVGGLGTGLHALVDRYDGVVQCWIRGWSACCISSVAALSFAGECQGVRRDTIDVGVSKSKAHHCAICTLLARFHARPTAGFALLEAPLSRHAENQTSVLAAPPYWAECCRPRGPPV